MNLEDDIRAVLNENGGELRLMEIVGAVLVRRGLDNPLLGGGEVKEMGNRWTAFRQYADQVHAQDISARTVLETLLAMKGVKEYWIECDKRDRHFAYPAWRVEE